MENISVQIINFTRLETIFRMEEEVVDCRVSSWQPHQFGLRIDSMGTSVNPLPDNPIVHPMGERACYRDYCPECDAQITIVDEECTECGVELAQDF